MHGINMEYKTVYPRKLTPSRITHLRHRLSGKPTTLTTKSTTDVATYTFRHIIVARDKVQMYIGCLP